MNLQKKNVKQIYNLPDETVFCKKCVVSNQRPRIVLDEKGICNACNNYERKKNINWQDREKEFKDLLDKYRRNDGRFDVIVPSSGGKDSSVVAHRLKFDYNMNPLTVTWSPHVYTDIGFENFQGLIKAGLSNILGTPDGKVHRKLTRDSFITMGEPFQPFIYGQSSFPMQVAVNYNVPLIMDGENGEEEYGGAANSNQKSFSLEDEVKYWQSNVPAEKWLEDGYTMNELSFYFPPSIDRIKKTKINRQFWSYYFPWNPQEHYYYSVENTYFKANPDGRSEGTYSKYASLDDRIDGFHYYLMFLKFGIGRATSDAAHEVRDGHISREEGVELVRRFDGEFPKKFFKLFLDYCSITEEDFWEICETWRAEHIWIKKENNWVLKSQVE